MFKKILIANRGEIGVRIVRTCREMGIKTVALYTESDRGSLHVRLADECVRLHLAADLFDHERMVAIAKRMGADAIHPGYGFLAEEADFIRACHGAGITFIGPPAEVVESLRIKINALQMAQAAGFPTPKHSKVSFGEENLVEIEAEAAGGTVRSRTWRSARRASWARSSTGSTTTAIPRSSFSTRRAS